MNGFSDFTLGWYMFYMVACEFPFHSGFISALLLLGGVAIGRIR
jgi:hypothetical protein